MCVNYKLHTKGLPMLLVVNCMLLIYATGRTTNSGDKFWYILVIMVNIAFMAVDMFLLKPRNIYNDKG